MEAQKRVKGLLSLCAKANRLVSGAQGVEIALKKKGGLLLIGDAALTENARSQWLLSSKKYRVPLVFCPFELGEAIGKSGRKIVLIQDEGFARSLCALFEAAGWIENQPNDTGVEKT